MKLAFSIAKRFLASGKLQTLMIVLGIAVGVSVQVFIGSLIGGLQNSLIDKTIGNSSQVTLIAEGDNAYITDYNQVITDLSGANNEIKVISANLNTNGFLIQGEVSEPTYLRGFDFTNANQIYHFDEKLTEGRLPNTLGEVAIGIGLADLLGVNLGDTIDMQIPLIGVVQVSVVGFFDFNVQAINNLWAISTLSTVQNALSLGDVAKQLEMQLVDVFTAQDVATWVESMMIGNYTTTNWIEQNAELLSGLQGQSTSSLMIQVFVMVSVVLGISSVLAITVLQKSKQIGILKAMGIKDKDASLVFLFEGFLLGIFGAIMGVLFGLGLTAMFTTFALNADGTPVVPLSIDYGFIALSALIALAASTFASLIPARRSSKLSVIEVIRNA